MNEIFDGLQQWRIMQQKKWRRKNYTILRIIHVRDETRFFRQNAKQQEVSNKVGVSTCFHFLKIWLITTWEGIGLNYRKNDFR